MRCNGFEGVGTNAVIRRPHHRHVVGKIGAIALVWRKRRPGEADRRRYRAEVIVWLGKDDQPSWSVFETRKRHLSRKKSLQERQCGIVPVFGRQKRRVDGHVRGDTEVALQGHVGRATDRPVTQPRASSGGATRAEPTTMDVDSTKYSIVATGVRNPRGEDAARRGACSAYGIIGADDRQRVGLDAQGL